MFDNYIKKLETELKLPLPGAEAQLLMGSGVRMEELRFMPMDETTKKSGVLILLYPYNNAVYSVLILRPQYNGTHSGQVALPGGKYEETDKDLIRTALREANEEIGVNSDDVKIIGQLTMLYIPPSNYVVYPAIGFLPSRPEFIPDKSEVIEIIEYPVHDLTDPQKIKTTEFHFGEISFKAPYFDINGFIVWGATAMILSEFSEIIKKIQ